LRRAILSYRVCAVSFNSAVAADEALGRCAPSRHRSWTTVVGRTTWQVALSNRRGRTPSRTDFLELASMPAA